MIYHFNNFLLDTVKFTLTRVDESIPVEPQVFNVILYLIEQKDRVVSRQELLDAIWKDKVVADSSISNHIKSARKVLDDDGIKQVVIKTIHGRGYQFVAKCGSKTDLNLNQIKTKKNLSKIIFTLLGMVILSVIIFWNNIKQSNSSSINNQEKSIAVLAFKDLSENSDQEYFSDGVSEELLNLFTRIPALKVASRTSSFSFKNKIVTIDNHGTGGNIILTTDRFGNSGSAFEFNGTDSFISIDNSVSLMSPTNELTMVAWVNAYS